MCGIVGCIGQGWSQNSKDAIEQLRKMGGALQHRGPDVGGEWIDDAGTVGIAHRRLAIIDLSDAGHQPMMSHSGRYMLVFNGEIYNHLQLRKKLESKRQGPNSWRGHSDTETVLAWIETFGVEMFLRVAIGMFAFALWDRSETKLYLARDRFGEKPLYYGFQNGVFLCPTRQDAQGVSMCEAMSSGLVPVTSNNTAIPEFVEDKHSGFLNTNNPVNFADSIEFLLKNPKIFLKISKNASSSIEKICSSKIVAKLELELFKD